jgi:DNA-binding transcriptional LysR family regulator
MIPMLDPEGLAAFVAVARLRSFTRAADELGTVQSAVSKRVRRLEDRLGMPLFDRGARADIRLTRPGELFLPQAQAALAQAEQLERLGRNLARGRAGPLRVGFVFSAAMTGLLTQVLTTLRELVIEPRIMETPAQIQALGQGRIDIGLLRPRPAYPDGCEGHTVHTEGLVVGMAHDHRLQQVSAITPALLAHETFIVPQFHEEVGLIDSIRQLARAGGFEIRGLVRTDDFVTAACMASAGMGVVLAPASLAGLALGAIGYRPVAQYQGAISLALAWRHDAPESAVALLLAIFPALSGASDSVRWRVHP